MAMTNSAQNAARNLIGAKMNDLIDREKFISTLIFSEKTKSIFVKDLRSVIEVANEMPSAEPERNRKFLEIVTEYPKICTYPECEGKPYYAIKYEENGETIVGFGTYKPEVLSQYLREYFIPSAGSGRKKGKWIRRKDKDCWECSECHAVLENSDIENHNFYYCYHCGADMMDICGYMDLELGLR